MEQARVLIAIVLSFLVLVLWNFFFAPQPPPQSPQESTQPTQSPDTPATPPASTSAAGSADTLEATSGTTPQPVLSPGGQETYTPREITIETPLYRLALDEKGGVFNQFVLKNFKEKLGDDAPLKEMIDPQINTGIFQVGFADQSLPGLETAVFRADHEQDRLQVSDNPTTIRCTWRSANGISVVKEFRFQPDSYIIDMAVAVNNESGQPIHDSLWVSMKKRFNEDKRAMGFSGPSVYMNDELHQIEIKEIEETEPLTGNMEWTALQGRYFMLSLIPQNSENGTLALSSDSTKTVENRYILPKQLYAENTPAAAFQIYIGPQSLKLLKTYNNSLDKAIDFGWFTIIAKPLLMLMNFIHDNLIANYGIAIIILTIITKIIFWPLGTKSYKSMNEMKKLQPLIAEIREKYKDDKQRQNQETMALYRTYKVNPMGGCLPMLAQIPVFFALYRMLYQAIELRHAPFFGWINDLSAPDRLGNFGFSLPLMEAPTGIPVLTLLMGASMLLQQKMSPPAGDPTQAKMMMLMPVVFTFIFINFSSGLVLYWFVNNLVSIGQQYYTQKKAA